jgi:hypothetical protein
MRFPSMTSSRVFSAFAGVIVAATTASAQLPAASPAGFAMGGNYTAMARGYEAVAFNPANLASVGRPFISIGMGVAGGSFGLEPVDLTSFYKVRGMVVDSAIRAGWVNLARQSGRQRIRGDMSVTPFAMSIGPIGLQTAMVVATDLDISPDAFEAMLFGNAGNNNGQPKTLSLLGTAATVSAFAVGAGSFAVPLPFKIAGGFLGSEHLSIGITGKYIVGAGYAIARDGGSTIGTTGNINFPVILPSEAAFSSDTAGAIPNLGIGTGADLGLAWSASRWRVGILAENVFNTFKWDTTKLAFAPNSGTLDPSDSTSEVDGDEQPFTNAPQSLKDVVISQAFKPAITIGMALKVNSFLTLTADVHKQTGGDEAISIGPRDRMGVGAELKILPFIPLRAGVASISDGWQAGAGFGFHFLGYELGISGSLRRRGAATESGIMIGAIGLGR